jgi:homoserine kinase type II
VRREDLESTVAVGCAYTIASIYPLGDPSQEVYARARHEAGLALLEAL